MNFSFFRKKDKNFNKMKSYLSRHLPLSSCDIRCNTEKGLISVILPVYNCEKYIEESINSVLSQTYTNLELIIVDDGSTDESGKIADSFIKKDKRVSVIHQKNMKLPTALNNGFAAAKGEFLTWTSADNRMMGSCLEILSTELTRNRKYDMVFGNMRIIDENGDIKKGHGWYEFPLLCGNVILPDSTDLLNTHANNTIGAAFLYRAGAASLLNGYSEYKFTLEDYDYFMRMNSLLNIKHIVYKNPIYEYRMHTDSLTSKDEEMGITASRPAMMEFDKIRRNFYTNKIFYYADGDDEIIKLLNNTCTRIFSPSAATERADKLPADIFYINFGNTAPTWEPPEYIPKFVICRDAESGVYGYDVMICKNAASFGNSREWISPTTDKSAVSYIILRAKNDLLYNYEGKLN